MLKKRSRGVTILSVWLMLSSVAGFLGNIVIGHMIPSSMRWTNLAWLAAALACGIGLFRLKEWGRKAAITLYALSMTWWAFSLLSMGPARLEEAVPDITPAQKTASYIIAFVIYLAWFLAITFFLTRPKVREQFKQA